MTGGDRRTSWIIGLAICLVWVPYLIKWKLGLNSDSAIPYLMARKILEGEYPLYLWRAEHLGAFDSYITAALMAVFGRNHVFLSYLPPLIAYVAAALLLLRTAPGTEFWPRAVLLLAAPPALFVAIVRPAFSQDSLLWLSWVLLIYLAPGLRPDPGKRKNYGAAVVAGLVLALGTIRIATALVGAIALTVLVLMAVTLEMRSSAEGRRGNAAARLIQLGLALGVGQLFRLVTLFGYPLPDLHAKIDLGLLPTNVPALAKGLLQFSPIAPWGITTSGLYTFYSGMPAALQVVPFASRLAHSPLTVLLTLGLAGFAVAGLIMMIREARSDVRAGEPPKYRSLYWAIILLISGGAFLVHTSVWDMGGARFLTGLFIPLVVLVGTAVTRLPRKFKIGLTCVWVALVSVGHARMLPLEDDIHRDIEEAIEFVQQQDLRAAYADYWLAYLTVALTHEELIVDPGYNKRYRPYYEHLLAQEEFAALEWRRHVEEGKRLRLPSGAYEPLEGKEFGEVVVSIYRRHQVNQ